MMSDLGCTQDREGRPQGQKGVKVSENVVIALLHLVEVVTLERMKGCNHLAVENYCPELFLSLASVISVGASEQPAGFLGSLAQRLDRETLV
jgi:hypothetical protein